MKKAIAIILLFAVALPCLFALNWFTFSLNLNVERACMPAFWTPGTTSAIENAQVNVIPLIGTATFATLGLAYKGTVNVSVDVGYSSFYRLETVNNENTLDVSDSYSYTMSFRQPGSESAYVFGQDCGQISPMTSAHYGSQISFKMYRVLNNVNPDNVGTHTVSNGTSLVKVCDFYIDELDMGDATTGNYVSLLVCQVTVE